MAPLILARVGACRYPVVVSTARDWVNAVLEHRSPQTMLSLQTMFWPHEIVWPSMTVVSGTLLLADSSLNPGAAMSRFA